MENSFKAVLFDVDGTLFDRNAAQKMVLEQIVKRLPHIFGDCEMGSIIEAFMESDRIATEDFESGAPSEGLREARSRQFLRLLDIREDCADIITDIYVRDYPKVNASMAGAVPLVKELSKRFEVGVVSNGLPDVQYQKLETMGLRDLLSCIVLSEEIGIRKPDPRIFYRAANLLRRQPPDCLYIGDSYKNDIVGAKAAGMLACWLNNDPSQDTDNNLKVDFVVSNLEELGKILIERE